MPELELIYPGFWAKAMWPALHENAHMVFGISTVTLIRTSKLILFDTGHFGTRVFLMGRLKQLGVNPDDIDIVVLSHLHWDHVLNAELFPKSTFVVHRVVPNILKHPPAQDWAHCDISGFLSRVRMHLAEDGEELASGVQVIETPGHTLADLSLVVNTGPEKVVVCGDAITHAWSFGGGAPRSVFGETSDAAQSFRRIAEAGSVIYPGHGVPFEHRDGRVRLRPPSQIEITAMEWFSPGADAVCTFGVPEEPAEVISPRRG